LTKREEQRLETYARIVDAAVESLIEQGFAATTALGVQNRVGVSRGALLHHFPTSEALSAAAVQRLVEVNIQAVRKELAAAAPGPDPVSRGIGVLYRASRRRSFATELELWSASRVNDRLRTALLGAERAARKQLNDVIDDIFGHELVSRPGYHAMVDLAVQFLRGLTVSRSIGRGGDHDRMVADWAAVMRLVLDSPAVLPSCPS
jgi:AcrR family transcriptional regulator